MYISLPTPNPKFKVHQIQEEEEEKEDDHTFGNVGSLSLSQTEKDRQAGRQIDRWGDPSISIFKKSLNSCQNQ
jgi:hypothetical protein